MRNSIFIARRRKRHLQSELLEPRLLLAGDILITELMASNAATLLDEDRISSDWVELYNKSHTPINLDGWYLTDDEEKLTKWQFPAVDVQPGGYLVVFASDKDRAAAGSELHANFKLSSRGEYLAIVEPDGTTISHVYDPFPEQFTDVSYGADQSTLVTTLVASGAGAKVLLPSSSAADVATSEWTAPGFDDSAWMERNTGIGFGADGQFDAVIDARGNIAQMLSSTASAYVRTPFDIDGSVPNFDGLQLAINYDDGFVAYLNGTEIASRNAPPSLAWDAVATVERGGVLTSLKYDNFHSSEDQSLFTLNGHAFWAANELRLTSAAASQSAAAWMTESIAFGADYSFSTSMAIDVTSPAGLSDTDGPGKLKSL